MTRKALTMLLLAAPSFLIAAQNGPALAMDPITTTQTILLIRHGEKPEAGLGQLNCQGLNRALALPLVIAGKFGKPIAVFAPNPAKRKDDVGIPYDYVRPLATIEPTAIANGLPVQADFGFTDTAKLRRALAKPALRDGLVVVAWEHKLIDGIARDILKANSADPDVVPTWEGGDFDSIYVLRLTRNGDRTQAVFLHDSEGLNGLPNTCPK